MVEQLGLIGLFGVLIWTRLLFIRRTSTSALSLGRMIASSESERNGKGGW
jgi:hypothetical protein